MRGCLLALTSILFAALAALPNDNTNSQALPRLVDSDFILGIGCRLLIALWSSLQSIQRDPSTEDVLTNIVNFCSDHLEFCLSTKADSNWDE